MREAQKLSAHKTTEQNERERHRHKLWNERKRLLLNLRDRLHQPYCDANYEAYEKRWRRYEQHEIERLGAEVAEGGTVHAETLS